MPRHVPGHPQVDAASWRPVAFLVAVALALVADCAGPPGGPATSRDGDGGDGTATAGTEADGATPPAAAIEPPGGATPLAAGAETSGDAPDVLIPAPPLEGLSLVDQDGRARGVADLRGRPALMTLTFTRCPMPNMCPATALRFAEVQEALGPAGRESVRLLMVTFDPAHDTPAVLREHGERYGADLSTWWLLTGEPGEVRRLASSYGFWYEAREGTFDHTMISVVLLPDGSVHRVLTGSAWDADEVAATLLRLAAD